MLNTKTKLNASQNNHSIPPVSNCLNTLCLENMIYTREVYDTPLCHGVS